MLIRKFESYPLVFTCRGLVEGLDLDVVPEDLEVVLPQALASPR